MSQLTSSVDDRYLTDEHRMLREMVREFAENEIAPIAREIDREGRFRVQLDETGAPVSVTLDGRPGKLLHFEPDADPDLLHRLAPSDVALLTAPTDMSMRAAIELRQASGHPVALVEEERLVGVCGDEEIYRGILRQTGMAESVDLGPTPEPVPTPAPAPAPEEAARRVTRDHTDDPSTQR